MRRTGQASSFWAWGQSNHLKTLKKEEDAKLAPLRERLKTEATPEARKQTQAEIEKIQEEFRARRRDANNSLFIRG